MSHAIELLMTELDAARQKVKDFEELLGEFAPEDEGKDRPVSWKEIHGLHLAPPEWLWWLSETGRVVGLIPPASVGFLAADSRIGKSLFLMNLGLNAARGNTFLDYPFKPGLRVLYVAAEGARPMTFKRCREVGEGLLIPKDEDIPFFFQPDGVPHGDYVLSKGRVDRWIEATQANIVVLDTVGYFHDGDENDAMETKRHIMRPLYDRATRYGCAFVVVHHNRKATGDPNIDQMQRGRGSSALSSDADFWWRLEAPPIATRFVISGERAQQYRTLHIDKNKYAEDGQVLETIVNFRNATFRRKAGTAGG